MPILSRLRRVWMAARHRRQLESDITEEVRAYVEERTERGIAAGLDAAEARRRAVAECGGIAVDERPAARRAAELLARRARRCGVARCPGRRAPPRAPPAIFHSLHPFARLRDGHRHRGLQCRQRVHVSSGAGQRRRRAHVGRRQPAGVQFAQEPVISELRGCGRRKHGLSRPGCLRRHRASPHGSLRVSADVG